MNRYFKEKPSITLFACSILSLAFCIAALIVAFLIRPSIYEYSSSSEYECQNSTTTFNQSICEGVNLLINGSQWIGNIENIGQYQRLILEGTPKNSYDVDIDRLLFYITTSVVGRNSDSDTWTPVTIKQITALLNCTQGEENCLNITIVELYPLQHSNYEFNISFSNFPNNVGDVVFTSKYGKYNGYYLYIFGIAGALFGIAIISLLAIAIFVCVKMRGGTAYFRKKHDSATVNAEDSPDMNIFWK